MVNGARIVVQVEQGLGTWKVVQVQQGLDAWKVVQVQQGLDAWKVVQFQQRLDARYLTLILICIALSAGTRVQILVPTQALIQAKTDDHGKRIVPTVPGCQPPHPPPPPRPLLLWC